MENTTAVATKQPDSIKSLLARPDVKSKFTELLGKKAQSFLTSLMQCVVSSDLLAKADPMSIYNAAMTAALLDLPLSNSIGFAYIVPYNQKQKDGSYKTVATFIAGYKSYIQLAQRTGLFKTISACPIFEGQLIEEDPLKGFVFDFKVKPAADAKPIGYAAYFSLMNGFEKTLYMTVDELKKHGKEYSQTYKKGYGLWEDKFSVMAQKTVIKLLLSKYAPLSVEMQTVITADQAVINDANTMDVSYVDNPETVVEVDKEAERMVTLINEATTIAKLEEYKPNVNPEQMAAWDAKYEELSKGTQSDSSPELFATNTAGAGGKQQKKK